MSKVATRFAPSPTGPLHIGGVRTALFNWLYSKNQGGKFYLRIEDTDKERSKEEFKDQIISSLKWIGVEHDGDEYIQSKQINNHIEIANELLEKGFAYKCYCSNEEIEEQKERARQKKIPYIYNRKWRDLDEKDAPKDIKPVIRFKSKIEGTSILKDLVQGDVEIENNTIEDFIIQSFSEKVNKLVVITGKGLHSNNENDPYVSKNLGILKYSVPEYILKNESLMSVINEITDAKIEDGGSGAFYIYLKKNKNIFLRICHYIGYTLIIHGQWFVIVLPFSITLSSFQNVHNPLTMVHY